MKTLSTRLFSLAAILGIGSSLSLLQADTGKTQAVVVIRHGEDAENSDWAQASDGNAWLSPEWKSVCTKSDGTVGWPYYDKAFTFINSSGIKDDAPSTVGVISHGLSGNWKTGTKDGTVPNRVQGELQAVNLAAAINAFLDSRGLTSITRVVTMDPREKPNVKNGPTPNPFDTMWPLGKQDAVKDFYLLGVRNGDGDKADSIKNLIKSTGEGSSAKLLPDEGSTILCWTGEGLSGTDGVVAQLYARFGINTNNDQFSKGSFGKGYNVYIFYNDQSDKGVVEKWKFDALAKSEGSGKFSQ